MCTAQLPLCMGEAGIAEVLGTLGLSKAMELLGQR